MIPKHKHPEHKRQPFKMSVSPCRYVLGLMAGTSGDGIDAACIRVEDQGGGMRVKLVLHRHEPFPRQLRRRLMRAMAPADVTTEEIARLHADLGEAFGEVAAETIKAIGRRCRPSFIGVSGQTVCHLPHDRGAKTVGLQLGEPARVAMRTGLPVVAEFRPSDIAAGGAGAPLVPWTDWVLFRSDSTARVVQNIGGIANLTWLPIGARKEDIIAFDTGPGNMIIDGLVSRATDGREQMDRNGRRAARGRILPAVLAQWMKHPYLRRRPPKTTGREEFGSSFIEAQRSILGAASRNPDDWIATATAFTARSIARAIRQLARNPAGPVACTGRDHRSAFSRKVELIVCGGGVHNSTLMAWLAAELPDIEVKPIDIYGIPDQAKEALSFAMLAVARMDGVSANLPQVTGARVCACMGNVVLPALSCRSYPVPSGARRRRVLC